MIRMAAAPLTAASPEKNGIEHAAEPDGRLPMPSQSATLPPFFLTLLDQHAFGESGPGHVS